MRLAVSLLSLVLAASSAVAETAFEADALKLFEAACLHNENQFDAAMAFATERSLPVPPEVFRQSLVKKGEGAVWLAQAEPFIALHANLSSGCGAMLKPVDEAGFTSVLDSLEGAELIAEEKFEGSWSRWYLLKRGDGKGILLSGFFSGGDRPSGFLRYMPGSNVVTDKSAMSFLLADYNRFESLKKKLLQ